jgi:hypothetical protein
VVRTAFAKRPLRQRLIALAAAYAIALASLVATFTAARAAAEAVDQPQAVLCHNGGAEQPAPAPDETTGKICIAACCNGCLTMAVAIEPPVAAAIVPHALSQRLAPLMRFVLVGDVEYYSHSPRGPPPAR